MSHDNYKKIVKLTKEANDQRYEAHSQENLKRHIKTKFKTTMIGALSKFEETFGELWGHGKNDSELSEQELDNKKKWDLVRTEILNNGNDQLRAALNEIGEYTVRTKNKTYEFTIKDKEGLTKNE